MSERAEHEVIVIGAGPGGLCLATELALAGARCTVLERRPTGTTDSRALGLHSRTLELLALRDLADVFTKRGNLVDHFRITVGGTRIWLNELDGDFQHVNIIPQWFIEPVFEERALANGAQIIRGIEVLDVRPDGDSVVVRTRDENGEREMRASWVVGCDGPKSITRESVGIDFPGHKYPYRVVFADVQVARRPENGAYMHVGRAGLGIGFDFGDIWRIGAVERLPLLAPGTVGIDELYESFNRVFGQDIGPSDPLWTSRTVFQLRHATTYRKGRVFLLGDAAHVQSPMGGQGLNLTIQDAMNLGWKLGSVIRGRADDRLLDTYDRERRSVAAKVLGATDRGFKLLMSPHLPKRALRRVLFPTLTSIPPVHDRIAGYLSGLGFNYPAPKGRRDRSAAGALVGRRVPNLRLHPTDGTAAVRLYDLFQAGKFVLIDQTGGRLADACAPWADQVVTVPARIEGRPKLAAHKGVLCRPDSYCAWAGADPTSLRTALEFWGKATSADRYVPSAEES